VAIDSDNENVAADRVFLRQRKVRFADLGEVFFARLLLNLVTEPLVERTVTVRLDLASLFPSRTVEDVLTRTCSREFTYSDRLTEDMVDFMKNALGMQVKAKEITTTVLAHYTEEIELRLSYLRDGDGIVLPKIIESFDSPGPGTRNPNLLQQ